jgi:hypothetical protein
MNCRVIAEGGLFVAICAADALWDDPASLGLAANLNAITERERSEYEAELDLVRQSELYPETVLVEPDVVPAELVLEWDAYDADSE